MPQPFIIRLIRNTVCTVLFGAAALVSGCGSGQAVQSDAGHTAITIQGTPATSATVGVRYSFTPTATGGGTLQFSVDALPSWAAFDVKTGTLSGTPATGDVGVDSGIVIHATDGSSEASLPAFSITVNASENTAPTISGAPVTTVKAGQSYSFTPSARDPDGDALTFGIQNKPAWASFDAATGTLSGTPGSADVGTYAGIVISVSDGSLSTALAPFSIDVTTAADSISLSWTPPTQNSDGSSLNDLAGYDIYYGTDPAALNQKIVLTSPGATSYVVTGLASGTWYFVVKSLSSSGVESASSNLASHTL